LWERVLSVTYSPVADEKVFSTMAIYSLSSSRYRWCRAPYRGLAAASRRVAEYDDPEKDQELLERIWPINHVHRIRAPLMVIHSADDPRVPVGEAEQIVMALRSRQVPVAYLRYEDKGYGLSLKQVLRAEA
jgi:dipeptidyl aminopeptidase/acylaminoacyl peptidase